jgi:hypothetical protein
VQKNSSIPFVEGHRMEGTNFDRLATPMATGLLTGRKLLFRRDPSEPDDFCPLAHEKICPYSHATRGNVDVQIEVKGA